MNKGDRIDFIKITEKLVTPRKVSKLFQNAEMMGKLPIFIQKKIMEVGSKSDPYISFIVEPYSLFLAYEIIDEEKILSMLPEDYELIETSMFDGNPERKCVIIGGFNVHTSVFWGNRLEVYIIAKNKKTNLISWIILDYETNTISFDPGRGFVSPTTEQSVLTTSFAGEVILDVVSEISNNRLQLIAQINRENYKNLNQTLWIDGNFSVDYSNELSDVKTKPFGLVFDPAEMKEALEIPDENLEMLKNTILQEVISNKPFEVCCFPYAQHFYTTSMPMENSVKDVNDLENRVREINRENAPEKPCMGYCYRYACKDGCQLERKKDN